MNNIYGLSSHLNIYNSSAMTSMVLRQQTLRLLFVFVATLFALFNLNAQSNPTLLGGSSGSSFEVFEYTIEPETKRMLKDNYILFETSGTSGDYLEITANLNGDGVSYRAAINEQGYAKVMGLENGIYENFRVTIDGVSVIYETAVAVYPNSVGVDRDNLPEVITDEVDDLNFTKEELINADPAKSTGCINNKLSNRSFENGTSDWYTNSGAFTTTARRFSGNYSLEMDYAGAYAGQTFPIGAHR
ncbi:MAG: hypothetical protein AAGA31_10700, partial [Bacteroidota bacterium]